MPSVAELAGQMELAVRGEPFIGQTGILRMACELTVSNVRQWDLVDVTRDPEASDGVVARAKRAVDELNLNRHRLVQQIDAAVAGLIDPPASATLATESPGMVLDRLSVLIIRRSRTAAASHFADRLPSLDVQLAALTSALETYLDELQAGTRRFMPYEHLKLYAAGPE
jgi:hypothetical protein